MAGRGNTGGGKVSDAEVIRDITTNPKLGGFLLRNIHERLYDAFLIRHDVICTMMAGARDYIHVLALLTLSDQLTSSPYSHPRHSSRVHSSFL